MQIIKYTVDNFLKLALSIPSDIILELRYGWIASKIEDVLLEKEKIKNVNNWFYLKLMKKKSIKLKTISSNYNLDRPCMCCIQAV